MDAADRLRAILHHNRATGRGGIASICSAHPLVLRAAMQHGAARGGIVLIEATCNQVNQDGGYTGLTPSAFRDRQWALADAAGLPRAQVVLGGDHLGPNPWRHLPAAAAMDKAEAMVRAYAAAGYRKLHLDASMACGGDAAPLPPETIAGRAARLCAAAESVTSAAGLPAPLYVVGTEVPTPGGARDGEDHLAITPPAEVAHTLALHRDAFGRAGCEAAFARVLAVVVQPGVEFGQDSVHDFAPAPAAALSAALTGWGGVFEAHSTDYQTESALAALVAGHFAILKVGPELTFALREAIFALDAIAAELRPGRGLAVRAALEQVMQDAPQGWQGYAAADDSVGRVFGLSDRVRYYWPVAAVDAAVQALFADLTAIPPVLVSQYLPAQYAALRAGDCRPDAQSLALHRVGQVLARYAAAAEGQAISAR